MRFGPLARPLWVKSGLRCKQERLLWAKSGPGLICSPLHIGGQHSLIGFHNAALPFACAHLVGCQAVFIVRNGAFVVAAGVLDRPFCCACGEQAGACYNHGRHCEMNYPRWSSGTMQKLQAHHFTFPERSPSVSDRVREGGGRGQSEHPIARWRDPKLFVTMRFVCREPACRS
jgi:hypothetical protein